jgi:hypothetical protein
MKKDQEKHESLKCLNPRQLSSDSLLKKKKKKFLKLEIMLFQLLRKKTLSSKQKDLPLKETLPMASLQD